MKSKFTSNKSFAVKEMEAWARTESNTHEASKYLYDGITDREERVLRVKLKELAKQRHKYLIKSAYEKKRFLERIRMKAKPIIAYYVPAGETRSLGDFRVRTSNIGIKSSNLGARSASQPILESQRLSSTRFNTVSSSGLSLSKITEQKSEQELWNGLWKRRSSERARDVWFAPRLRPEQAGWSLPPTADRHFSRKQSFTNEVSNQHKQTSSILRMGPTSKTTEPTEPTEPRGSSSTALPECRDWAKKKSNISIKRADSSKSLIYDPRYSLLEESLCPYKAIATVDVKSLVENLESLRLPAKTPSTSNQKRKLKVLSFMNQRGIMS